MKTFTFRFDPKATPGDLFVRLAKAAKTRISDVHKDEISSHSIAAILSTMTAGRIDLFYCIADREPVSLYQLAQMLDRDQANVIRDVKILEGLGLVSLKSEKYGDRERLRPVARYNRIVFDFGRARSSRKNDRAAS